MALTGETGPGTRDYYPATQAILDRLAEDATIPFECSHGCGDDEAVGIYEVPRGCVALPGLETQALCQHHRWSDGSFEGMLPIVDLSVNAVWSERFGERPDYCIARDPQNEELRLVPFSEFISPNAPVQSD